MIKQKVKLKEKEEKKSFFKRNPGLFSYVSGEYKTPKWLYDQLNREFHFELDPCTTADNPLGTPEFCTKEMDGLSINWSFWNSIYVNPPYGRDAIKWVAKAYHSNKMVCNTIVMLLPARTDTKWFHDYIYKKPNVEIRFLRGRLKFENQAGYSNTAPFPSMIVIFRY